MPSEMPKFDDLFNPTMDALRQLGGSARNEDIVEFIIESMEITNEIADHAHLGSETQTELAYRAAWARTYLKKQGLIENSGRGVWSLTQLGRTTPVVDQEAVKRDARNASRAKAIEAGQEPPEEVEQEWKDELVDVMQAMDPYAFERLCQRVLRESGFVDVQVTKRSGDGGIDGHGLVRLGGLLSFPILFQAKRYKGSVSAPVVRDFRGAMQGRSNHGLIITTGRFTKDAQDEATRPGAFPIDLIDGRQLAESIRQHGLGVSSKEHVTHDVTIDRSWFESV